MLASVKAPLRSWKAPIISDTVGAMRNISANTKNGVTPTHAESVRGPTRDRRAAALVSDVATIGPSSRGLL